MTVRLDQSAVRTDRRKTTGPTRADRLKRLRLRHAAVLRTLTLMVNVLCGRGAARMSGAKRHPRFLPRSTRSSARTVGCMVAKPARRSCVLMSARQLGFLKDAQAGAIMDIWYPWSEGECSREPSVRGMQFPREGSLPFTWMVRSAAQAHSLSHLLSHVHGMPTSATGTIEPARYPFGSD